jgi:hypothetical protein
MHLSELPNSQAAILARVIQPGRDDLSATAARAFLKFEFTPEDRERMHDLAVKNQAGTLTEGERDELLGYIRIGRFLDIITAKARLSLKKHGHDA